MAAVVLASAAAFPIRARLLCALVAVALLLLVGVARLRAGIAQRTKSKFDARERAEWIREQRSRR